MLRRLILLAVLYTACFSPLLATPLTIERIYDSPSLSGSNLLKVKISPDGSRVTFLKGKHKDHEKLDLWQYDLKTGQASLLFDSQSLHQGVEVLSEEEKARRERTRTSGSGIIEYEWSHDGKALIFPLAGDVFYWRVGDKQAHKIISSPQFETDIRFSPKSNYLSYIRDQDLYITHIASKQETRLTFDGGGVIKNGMAELIAQEEMKRMTGYWWAGDESKIAFTQIDESPVEEVYRNEIYADEIKVIKQRYPFAGKHNVKVRLAVAHINSKKIQWINLGAEKDIYLPRVKWTRNSNQLSYQWQSRDQKTLELRLVTLDTMKQKVQLTETSTTWVDLHEDLYFLTNGEQFIWTSEKDGFNHIYLHSLDGSINKQLTQGRWVVNAVKHIDEKKQLLYFTGRKDTPLEEHLYSVSMDKGNIQRLTKRPGFHEISFAKDGQSFVNKYSNINHPPQVSLHAADGKHITWLMENKVDSKHPLHSYLPDWVKPTFGTIKASSGEALYYRLYQPAKRDKNKQYPVIVYVYGGPHAQQVRDKWQGQRGLFFQYLAQNGYAVFTLDNRGTNYRGKAFEDEIYQAAGDIEIQDQIEGVKFLRSMPWVDPERIGIYGHSYGGYLTLMAMFKAPAYFKAGVSGAPVTDWLLYDTHYTERYLGHPDDSKQVYENASVFPYAKNLKGPLLIYHGMADDNVLFKNSTKLYQLLQDNNLPFWAMDYPGKKHSIKGKKTRMHMHNMIKHFFDLYFKKN